MFRPLLFRLLRFVFWAVLIVPLCAAVLRLGVWATGSEYISSQASGNVPQVFRWDAADPDFGGMSALIMAPDGASLTAGGDHGALVTAQILRDAAGQITGIQDLTLDPVQLRSGKPPTDFKMDLEALTDDPAGGLITAFEGFVRIERLARPGTRPEGLHPWDLFVHLFGNRAFEALATLPGGRVLAITEPPVAEGLAGAMIWNGARWRSGPEIPVTAGFNITGADLGPDGCLYLVERRYALASGFTFGLRRLSGGPNGWEDTLLYRSSPATLGNAEGIAAWQDGQGQIVLSVLTDNGFWPLTPTRLIEMRLTPGQGCALTF